MLTFLNPVSTWTDTTQLAAIREELVTSLQSTLGPEGNLLQPGPSSCKRLVLPTPILDNAELAKIIHINDEGSLPYLDAHVVHGIYDVHGGGEAPRHPLDEIAGPTPEAIVRGARVIVPPDRGAD